MAIDGPLSEVMTRSPSTVSVGELLTTACEILSRRKISELPVVDTDGRPAGLIDITDVVAVEIQGPKSKVQSRIEKKQSIHRFRLHNPEP
jgi:signal-transduction protein with cAMP-binding, CBS, and nucleotidyltransferase domain